MHSHRLQIVAACILLDSICVLQSWITRCCQCHSFPVRHVLFYICSISRASDQPWHHWVSVQ